MAPRRSVREVFEDVGDVDVDGFSSDSKMLAKICRSRCVTAVDRGWGVLVIVGPPLLPV